MKVSELIELLNAHRLIYGDWDVDFEVEYDGVLITKNSVKVVPWPGLKLLTLELE